MQTVVSAPIPTLLEPRAAHVAGARQLYGVFRRGGQNFGLPVEYMREVVAAGELTRLAQTPVELAGVFNLRGEILPVILVDSWLGLERRGYEARKPILVLRQREVLLGIQVDAMEHVQPVPTAQVSPHPDGPRLAHLVGLWRRSGDALVTLLDGAALFETLRRHFGQHA